MATDNGVVTEINKALEILTDNLRRLESLLSAPDAPQLKDTAFTEQVSQLKEFIGRLQEFTNEPNELQGGGALTRLKRARELHAKGAEAWEQIGASIVRLSLQVLVPEGRRYTGSLPPADSKIIETMRREWGTPEDAQQAFQEADKLEDSLDKWLYLLRTLSELTQGEIAELVGVGQSAIAMRVNRINERLAIGVGVSKLWAMAEAAGAHNLQRIGSTRDRSGRVIPSLQFRLPPIEIPIRVFVIPDTLENVGAISTRSMQSAQTTLLRMQEIVNRIIRGSTDRETGDTTYEPGIAIYNRRKSDIYMYAAKRFNEAYPLIRTMGEYAGSVSGPEAMQGLARQIQSALDGPSDMPPF